MIRSFRTFNATDYEVNKLQDNASAAFKAIFGSNILDGSHVKNVLVSSVGDTKIDHGLGREFEGFIVTNSDANATIWQSATTNTLKSRYLLLNASANVTISLWIF